MKTIIPKTYKKNTYYSYMKTKALKLSNYQTDLKRSKHEYIISKLQITYYNITSSTPLGHGRGVPGILTSIYQIKYRYLI